MMGPVETCLRAAIKLVAQGWWQTGPRPMCGGHCPVTAIHAKGHMPQAYTLVAEAIRGYPFADPDAAAVAIIEWNDAPTRTQKHALYVMVEAAELARERGL